MDDFVALDVETANCHPSSICSIGAVKVVAGDIVDKRYSLVNPEPCWFSRGNMAIHGITSDDTCDAPSFGSLWQQWQPWLDGFRLVAHNAQFDYRCICEACRIYRLEIPDEFQCTLMAARRQIPRAVCPSKSLPYLCDFFGIVFDKHHNALADAEACAKLAVILI